MFFEEEEEEEEEFITSGNWRGKHNSLSRGAGADLCGPPTMRKGLGFGFRVYVEGRNATDRDTADEILCQLTDSDCSEVVDANQGLRARREVWHVGRLPNACARRLACVLSPETPATGSPHLLHTRAWVSNSRWFYQTPPTLIKGHLPVLPIPPAERLRTSPYRPSAG